MSYVGCIDYIISLLERALFFLKKEKYNDDYMMV